MEVFSHTTMFVVVVVHKNPISLKTNNKLRENFFFSNVQYIPCYDWFERGVEIAARVTERLLGKHDIR